MCQMDLSDDNFVMSEVENRMIGKIIWVTSGGTVAWCRVVQQLVTEPFDRKWPFNIELCMGLPGSTHHIGLRKILT